MPGNSRMLISEVSRRGGRKCSFLCKATLRAWKVWGKTDLGRGDAKIILSSPELLEGCSIVECSSCCEDGLPFGVANWESCDGPLCAQERHSPQSESPKIQEEISLVEAPVPRCLATDIHVCVCFVFHCFFFALEYNYKMKQERNVDLSLNVC